MGNEITRPAPSPNGSGDNDDAQTITSYDALARSGRRRAGHEETRHYLTGAGAREVNGKTFGSRES